MGTVAERSNKGFTIVELLIVIVVIAILAAITIVAYNGIQNQAKASAAQAAAKQALTKIQAYAVQNADQYPATIAAAGLTSSGGTTYQYRVDNSANPKIFCLTVRVDETDYFVANGSDTPVAGACAGHGGTEVRNLSYNPSFESSGSVNNYNAINSWGSGGAFSGTRFIRSTRANTSGSSGPWFNAASPTAGSTYRVALAARGNVTTPRSLNIEWIGNSGATLLSRTTITTITPTSSWAQFSGTAVAPSGAEILRLAIYTDSSSTGTTSDYMDIDGIMITESSNSYQYADGNSPGWIWSGTPNSSTSTGPPL
ncbi:hypothetical protein CMN24_03580 [Candidatus Saccharibacteria bacterium]|nr:hypothetical protein [Candidatus Saccharibacteria bacterium]|tara:strand:+ start:1113 stop:2048 length:936 start_codon:yes stop_codon:yes gene_type:complete